MDSHRLFLIAFYCMFALPVMAKDGNEPATCIAWKKIVSREVEMGVPKGDRDTIKRDGSNTLTKLLTDAIQAGTVTVYSNLDASHSTPISLYERSVITGSLSDTIVLTDPITRNELVKVIRREIDYRNIHKYRVQEEWAYDPAMGVTTVQILSIAPVRDIYASDGTLRGVQAMFWMKFRDAEPIIERYDRAHADNAFVKHIWNDYFATAPAVTNDGVWGTQVMRTVEMPADKEVELHHLKDNAVDNSLLDMLLAAKYSGRIATGAAYDHGLINMLAANNFRDSSFIVAHTTVILDPITSREEEKTILSLAVNRKDIPKKLQIVEHWSFDPFVGSTTIQMKAMAVSVKEESTIEPMFWMRFKDIRSMVADYDMYHQLNSFAASLHDSYFLSDTKPVVMQ